MILNFLCLLCMIRSLFNYVVFSYSIMSSDIDSFSDEDEEEVIDYASDSEDSESGSEKEEPVKDEDIEQTVEVPKDIKIDSSIVGIHCHPTKNLIAAATIDGPVHLYTYSAVDGNKELLTYQHHKKHCRAVKFSPTGEYLFTGSQDSNIYVIDLETHSEFRKFCRKDGSSIYSLLPIDNYFLASGEDDGQVIIWDFRMASPIACFEDCSDYISSLAVSKDKKTLLATTGEGILNAYNVKSRKLLGQSDSFDVEFSSVGIFKADSKVVVGSSDGSLNIFNWGEYSNISDRFPGHPGSVECMQVISDDIVCTGCEDGKIRAVQLFPNRFLGVLGHHSGFSVESLSVSCDSSVLASSSHDQCIKFWDLSCIEIEKNEDVKNTKKKNFQLNKQVESFFADLEEDE